MTRSLDHSGASSSTANDRPRLLVLNQYYKPGVEATAHLLAELCEALAEEYEVTVVTGRLAQYPDIPSDEVLDGVRVIRTRSTAYDRSVLHRRAANYLTFMAGSLCRSLRLPKPSVVLALTDPPMIGDVGLIVAKRFRVPLLVVSEDVFPEIAVELKRLRNPILVSVLRALVSLYLRHADRVVAIGETMRLRLEQKGARPERISVIENWVDTTKIVPRSKDTGWARDNELVDRFVVMHSGNIGHVNDLVTLIRSATFLRDLTNLRIVVIGFGALQNVVRDVAEQLDVDVVFLDYQPREVLSDSLSSADLHYVGLARGLSGFVVPSRAYGIMAAARPMLVSADEDSETVRVVHDHDCGIVVPPGRPDLVARAIRDAYQGHFDLDEMGRRGRAYVEREADKSIAMARYREVIGDLIPKSDGYRASTSSKRRSTE